MPSHFHLSSRRRQPGGKARCALPAALLLSLLVATPAATQPAQPDETIEEIVVTGTRRLDRTVTDSLSPIDVLSEQDLQNQGFVELDDLLRTTVPSYQVNRHPIDDASTLVRPAKLRGLSPDQTLVLVNSKRRHRSAVIAFVSDGPTTGSQGPDLTVIPTIALERVEVLRDGAAAQYGSDAIAGVMNFILKDSPSGGSLQARFGEHYEGDGETTQVSGNIGLPLGSRGFVNLSAEYWEEDETIRTVLRDDVAALLQKRNAIGADTTGLSDTTQIWGKPIVHDSFHFFVNSGYELSQSAKLYAFGNYAKREVEGGFFFRNPDTRAGVFRTIDDNGTPNNPDDDFPIRLIGTLRETNDPAAPLLTPDRFNTDGDLLLPDMSAIATDACDDYRVMPEDADAPVADLEAEQALLARLATDNRCFSFNARYPNGFTPRFGGEVTDYSVAVGVEGELASGLRYDLSVNHGQNEADFFIFNTVNAARGSEQPGGARFDPGNYVQSELNFQANFVMPVELNFLAAPLHVAFGGEWREEEFEIEAGDRFSWIPDASAEQTELERILVVQGFTPASNGFSGFTPGQQGEWSRDNFSFYLDLETDLSDDLMVGLAGRYEDYEDFGSTIEGKLAARYRLSEALSLRGTVSTGFRAPTPGQANVRNVTTQFDFADRTLLETGLVPPTDPVARRYGGVALEPEEATNYTVGLNWNTPGGMVITLDAFRIEVNDRLAQSAPFTVTQEDVDALAGLSGVRVGSELRYYTNAWDTETTGLELVATWQQDFGALGVTDFILASSFVNTEVTGRDLATFVEDEEDSPGCIAVTDESGTPTGMRQCILIGERTRLNVENLLPSTRTVLTANHHLDNWRITGRASYWGSWETVDRSRNNLCPANSMLRECPIETVSYGDAVLFDLEIAYTLDLGVTLIFGGQNIFNKRASRHPNGANSGQAYHEYTPFDFNGGYWYTRIKYDF